MIHVLLVVLTALIQSRDLLVSKLKLLDFREDNFLAMSTETGSNFMHVLRTVCQRDGGFEPNFLTVGNSLESLLSMVAAGRGVLLAPQILFRHPTDGVSFHILDGAKEKFDFVCLVGARQRIKSRRVTLKQYLQLPHAMVLTGDGHQARIDQPLKALGQKRHVVLRIPFYIPAILAIAQTDLVLTVPRTLANVTKQISTLRTIEPPRELKAFPYFMSWHPRLTNETSAGLAA